MIRKIAVSIAALGLSLGLVGFIAYLGNTAPEVPRVDAVHAADRPYVVKLHAQWCPICVMTKGVWTEIEQSYQHRVNLVVLDFTNDDTTAASEAEVERLGLNQFYEDYGGSTGTIAVLDGRTKHVRAVIQGSRDFADYRSAIDTALADSSRR